VGKKKKKGVEKKKVVCPENIGGSVAIDRRKPHWKTKGCRWSKRQTNNKKQRRIRGTEAADAEKEFPKKERDAGSRSEKVERKRNQKGSAGMIPIRGGIAGGKDPKFRKKIRLGGGP